MNSNYDILKSKTGVIFGYNQLLGIDALIQYNRFSLSTFEDFNRLIEAIVLYDKVLFLGEYDISWSPFYSALNKESIFETLTDKKITQIIKNPTTTQIFEDTKQYIFGRDSIDKKDTDIESLLNLRIAPNEFDQLSYNTMVLKVLENNIKGNFDVQSMLTWISENIFKTKDEGGNFYYFARSLVYSSIAESTGLDYAPDFLRMPFAALSFAKINRPIHKVLYDALVDRMKSEIETLSLLGMPVSIFIPPLTANILSKKCSPKEYPSEILELRDKFKGFRVAYSEFIQLLRDPNITLKEKISAKERLYKSILGVIESGEGQHTLNLRTIWDKLISSQIGESEISTKVSFSGLVSVLLDQLLKERIKGRARSLFDLWTDTLNLKNYGKLIEETFKTEINTNEIDFLKKYSNAIRAIIKSAGKTI